jgi:hypothetical protein
MMLAARVTCATALAALFAASGAAAAATTDAPPRPSSFAPNAAARRPAYGTPIQAPILHRRTPAHHATGAVRSPPAQPAH